jgi:LysM repeat protein
MPDEPSLHDVLRGSLAHHAEHLGDPVADITTVWSRVDRRRANRRGIAVVGSVAVLAAGATGIMLVANPTATPAPLDGTDGPAALSWACTGPLGSDGAYDYFEACEALPGVVTPTTPPFPIVPTTIAGSVPVSSVPEPSVPVIGTAPPTTAFSPFVSQEQVYVVAEGDSVYRISDRYDLAPDVVSSYNGWPEGINHPLSVGEHVLIPPGAASTATTVVYFEQQHVVVEGDTLTAIAQEYGMDVTAIVNYNAWPDGLDHVIQPDDVVLIPPYGIGGASATLPPVSTAIVSVPESSAPIVIVTNAPTCGSTLGDLAVTVPCGTAPITVDVPTDVVVSVVAAGPAVAGTYRCAGPLGKDSAYHYYSVCELIAVPTSSVAGTAVSTTTFPPPATTAILEVSGMEQVYIVRPGDSVFSISELFGIGMDVLASYNDWTEGLGHPLIVDETVKIPPNSRVPDPLELGEPTVTYPPLSTAPPTTAPT